MSELYRPIVDLTISPNGAYHTYGIAEHDGVFTTTPHQELLGYNISRLIDRQAPPMDEATRALYDAVKALSARFRSVSITESQIEIEGPERLIDNHYRGDWPADLSLDWQVVDCLSQHLGFAEAPQLRVRTQTAREIELKINDNVIEGIRLGLLPPEGWAYRKPTY